MKNPMVNLAEERQKDISNMQNIQNVRNEYKNMSVEECKQKCFEDRFEFDACFLNITSDLNVSTSIRTLHLLGAKKIFVMGKKKLDRRALVGAEFYQDIQYLGGLDMKTLEIDDSVFLELINRDENYFPIYVEMGGENLNDIIWKNLLKKSEGKYYKPLLIFGNEGRGIGENIFKLRDKLKRSAVVSIPMRGVLRSLNVSASVAMVTWDMVEEMYSFE